MSPLGTPKFKTGLYLSELEFVTVACLPASSVVTVPTVTFVGMPTFWVMLPANSIAPAFVSIQTLNMSDFYLDQRY